MTIVRSGSVDDAELLASFIVKLDHEGEYLLYEPGERKGDINSVQAYLNRIKNEANSIVYVAQDINNKIVGFACGESSPLKRMSHVMSINIGILEDYQGCGIGKKFIEELLSYSKAVGIVRVEASVVKNNVRCIGLLKKYGFIVEGVKSNAIMINRILCDVCVLAKLN